MKDWLIAGEVSAIMAIVFSMPKSDLYSLLGLIVVIIIILLGIIIAKDNISNKNY